MADVNAIHEVFPYLCVSNTNEAVAFYEKAFGAKFKYRLVEPSGRVGHAEIELGPITLMLSDEYPEMGVLAPKIDGPRTMTIHLHVDDCDALAKRAVDAGATLVMPPVDQFYGERSCLVRDPFGHAWLLGHSIEKVTPEEMQRRYTQVMEDGKAC